MGHRRKFHMGAFAEICISYLQLVVLSGGGATAVGSSVTQVISAIETGASVSASGFSATLIVQSGGYGTLVCKPSNLMRSLLIRRMSN